CTRDPDYYGSSPYWYFDVW
nr:immunoglobulin heavy chain junction region [Mus musculus]MBK4195037.1 immunoglobulin heavy chain junction region [Mus musculus]